MIQKSKDWLYPWLKFAERYLKTDTIYLAKGGFWLIMAQGVAMVAGLALSLAFANLLPKESFGTYKFILSTVGILSVFSFTGLSTSITQSVANGFTDTLRQGFKMSLKWSGGVFLGGVGLGIYYFMNGNLLLAYSFLIAGILSPLSTAAGLYGVYLFGKKDFRRNTFYSIGRNIVPALVLIITLLISQSLPVIITVYFLIGALVPLYFYWKTLKVYQPIPDRTKEDPGLRSYSGHLSIMDVIGSAARYIDKIIVFHYLGAANLAIYSFAIAPVEQLQGGKKILSTLIFPKVSERSFGELQKSAPHRALILTVYALALAGGYAIFAPYFYKFFFPQYIDSVWYSQIYSLTLLAVAGTIFNEVMSAHKKQKELYVHRTVVPVVQIGLFFALFPMFGILGLILTHVVTRIFTVFLGYYFVKYPFKTTSGIGTDL